MYQGAAGTPGHERVLGPSLALGVEQDAHPGRESGLSGPGARALPSAPGVTTKWGSEVGKKGWGDPYPQLLVSSPST